MAESLRSADREFVEVATREFERSLAQVVAEHERNGHGARAVLGEPRDFALRAVRSSAPLASPWDELAGPFVRSEDVQTRLGSAARQWQPRQADAGCSAWSPRRGPPVPPVAVRR